jgi:hypothetical protein
MLEPTEYPECGMENYIVKAKVACSMEKRSEEGKNELDKEIEIEIPNCKLHLFHNESINESYITRVQNCIKILYGESMQERYGHLKESSHKGAKWV